MIDVIDVKLMNIIDADLVNYPLVVELWNYYIERDYGYDEAINSLTGLGS